MKTNLFSIQLALILAACCCVRGQGTLQVDQQISNLNPPGGYVDFTTSIVGQSFVPTLSSVGFATFFVGDPHVGGAGVTALVNLWSGSLTSGTLLGSTAPVFIPDRFNSSANFFFSAPVAVTPGTTYYLQLAYQSGDSLNAGLVPGFLYSNGAAFYGGTFQNENLWFQEGIVVPEPSSIILSFLGLAGFVLQRRKKQ